MKHPLKNPPFASIALLIIGLSLLWQSRAHAQLTEETCAQCDLKVLVTGQFRHGSRDSAEISGAPGQERAFREEIRGTNFTVTVLNLPAGQYQVDIGLTELYFDAAGLRVFDILCGEQVVASNLDVFTTAGGMSRACHIRSRLEHPGDALRGPLAFHFVARVNNAKLNTFQLADTNGTVLVSFSARDLVTLEDPSALVVPEVTGPVIWRDPSEPLELRVQDLIRRMSLAEKAAQMRNNAPAIPRIGLPAYDYWNECLHGVGRAGVATVFPQAIGMAATWDVPLLRQVADTIATEARAKHHEYARANRGDSAKYYGLTFWTPNINIFRDPRWGRGQETYGEDPFLTSQLGVAFIRGLQGDDPKYVKAMACAKHFAVHSGPEPDRHTFDAIPTDADYHDTYLPQFEAAIRQGRVGAVMGAYNRLYGEPACSSTALLTDLLRNEWGFTGHVVSDCGAIFDIYANHKTVPSQAEAAARAVKAGCDLCCGSDYGALTKAVQRGLITEPEIDQALGRLLEARFRLGLFDPPEAVPFAQIPFATNDCPEHAALALRVARESIVLLKNEDLLPLDRRRLKRIAVIGTNANSVPVLLGNYNGIPSKPVTILDGIQTAAGEAIEVSYEAGCALAVRSDGRGEPELEAFDRAIATARRSDVVIYVGGLSPQLEGEEMRVVYDGFAGGDRTRIELPSVQTELLKALQATGKPVVFVNCSGSAVAMPWEADHLPAIVQAWYPGGPGGRAVADVLFGLANPAGRLPVTFYRSTADLSPFEDYSMSNRTYRYFASKPLFAFGHGLSYTRFQYSNARVDRKEAGPADTIKLSVRIRNTGKREGDEVVQVYARNLSPAASSPRLTLCAFGRLNIDPGAAANITLNIPMERLRLWNPDHQRYEVPTGDYELAIGASSEDIRATVRLKSAAGVQR